MTSSDDLDLAPSGAPLRALVPDESARTRAIRHLPRLRDGLDNYSRAMASDPVTLDESGMALLHQVLVGLAHPSSLPVGSRYLDSEGNAVAAVEGGRLRSLQPVPWRTPDEARTGLPVAVAPPEALPVSRRADVAVLLPTGGIRVDDHRHRMWVDAWRSAADTVIEVPVPPAEAPVRAEQLAAAYSTSGLVELETVPMPGSAGRVVFFTGLSGSGKSTIARRLVERLAAERTVTLLDGDVVRTHLSRGLGFSKEDRDTNIRRIGWVAAEVAKHGGLAVCAPIAPYDETRRWVRQLVDTSAGPGSFLLVWVSTPLDVCEERDVKGLYARARAGQLSGFTGIDDPYEPPADADLVIDTTTTALDDAVSRVHDAINA
jgi:sulfate adenylyltransferase